MNATHIPADGDGADSDDLLQILYDELRRIASRLMAKEPMRDSLQTTALVHEAYLRLADSKRMQMWDGPGHFYSAAAEAMRRILVESARRRQSLKRGGHMRRVELDSSVVATEPPPENLLLLDECLSRLESKDPVKSELVKLRYFAGLSHQDAAGHLGISRTTADRYWAFAKAWLYREMERSTADDDSPE